MTGAHRNLKRAIILAFFICIIFAVSWPSIKPKEHQCFNGRIDPGEDEIDCGGICERKCPPPDKPPHVEDVKIEWAKAVKDGNSNYDLIAKVVNTNKHWGASSVGYKFTIFDNNNVKIAVERGETYVVPIGFSENNGAKYIIRDNFVTESQISKVDFELYNFNWGEVKDILDLKELSTETIIVKDALFGPVTEGNAYYYAYGVTKNNSLYSFYRVDISVVLFDDKMEPIAVGKTDQWTIGGGEGWEFRVFWQEPFVGDVLWADFKAETNIYDQSNFMSKFGTGKKYKSTSK
jgi:hypothetical protein